MPLCLENTQMLIDRLINAIFPQGDKRLLTFNYKEAPKAITLEDVKNEPRQTVPVPP